MFYYFIALLLVPLTYFYSSFDFGSSSTGTLYTNLDDNTVCYVQINGVGVEQHKNDDDFKWGIAKDLHTSPELVISSLQYTHELLTNEQVHEFTKTVDHLPNYDEDIDYCAEFKQKMDFWSNKKHKAKQVDHIEPVETNLLKRIIGSIFAIFTTID